MISGDKETTPVTASVSHLVPLTIPLTTYHLVLPITAQSDTTTPTLAATAALAATSEESSATYQSEPF